MHLKFSFLVCLNKKNVLFADSIFMKLLNEKDFVKIQNDIIRCDRVIMQ